MSRSQTMEVLDGSKERLQEEVCLRKDGLQVWWQEAHDAYPCQDSDGEARPQGLLMAKKTGKKDACYHKVKSRYKKWPSAYASGALVKCRKKGAKNWGKGRKK